MKFLADRNLGKLTKWLRILGYDAVIWHGEIGRSFLREGARQGRVVLTRRRDMAERNYLGTMLVIYGDKMPQQLTEVIGAYSLDVNTAHILTICLHCNETLRSISRTDVEDRVPPYVFQTQQKFRICTNCGQIFWAGTHRDNVCSYLRQHNLIDHP